MLPTRRAFLCSPAVLVAGMMAARAQTSFRFALTPVFLDNDAAVLSALQAALEYGLANAVELVQRRTYQEITGALLDGSVDAAWTCGYPFLQHRQSLTVMGVPVWRGEPRYQSYLIAADDDPATDLAGLAGGVHAFSDPDSNSGFLVTASDLARMGQTPETYFSRSIFTYGHRNVVRAVAGGLARSGSVDGYVWETLAEAEPDLTVRTRVVTRSEWLGFPPFVARTDRMSEPGIAACRDTLLSVGRNAAGREALRLLRLDGVETAESGLYDGIAARMADVGRLR